MGGPVRSVCLSLEILIVVGGAIFAPQRNISSTKHAK